MNSDAHFRLRLPRSLKEWVEARAKANNRSINAEIVSYLETIRDQEDIEAAAEVHARQRQIAELSARIEAIGDAKAVEFKLNIKLRDKVNSNTFPEIMEELLKLSDHKIELYSERRNLLHKEWIKLTGVQKRGNDG